MKLFVTDLIVADQFLEFVGMHDDMKPADLSKTEFFTVNASKADLGKYLLIKTTNTQSVDT